MCDTRLRENSCFIPDDVVGFYRRRYEEDSRRYEEDSHSRRYEEDSRRYEDSLKNPFENKETAVKMILSIYYDYQVAPTEYNDYEPHDPHGLGILEIMCMKLIMFPQHTQHIRTVYGRLADIHERIRNGKGTVSIVDVMCDTFTLCELEDYGL